MLYRKVTRTTTLTTQTTTTTVAPNPTATTMTGAWDADVSWAPGIFSFHYFFNTCTLLTTFDNRLCMATIIAMLPTYHHYKWQQRHVWPPPSPSHHYKWRQWHVWPPPHHLTTTNDNKWRVQPPPSPHHQQFMMSCWGLPFPFHSRHQPSPTQQLTLSHGCFPFASTHDAGLSPTQQPTNTTTSTTNYDKWGSWTMNNSGMMTQNELGDPEQGWWMGMGPLYIDLYITLIVVL